MCFYRDYISILQEIIRLELHPDRVEEHFARNKFYQEFDHKSEFVEAAFIVCYYRGKLSNEDILDYWHISIYIVLASDNVEKFKLFSREFIRSLEVGIFFQYRALNCFKEYLTDYQPPKEAKMEIFPICLCPYHDKDFMDLIIAHNIEHEVMECSNGSARKEFPKRGFEELPFELFLNAKFFYEKSLKLQGGPETECDFASFLQQKNEQRKILRIGDIDNIDQKIYDLIDSSHEEFHNICWQDASNPSDAVHFNFANSMFEYVSNYANFSDFDLKVAIYCAIEFSEAENMPSPLRYPQFFERVCRIILDW